MSKRCMEVVSKVSGRCMEDIWKKRGTIGVGTLHIIRGGHRTYLLNDKNNWGGDNGQH